MTLRVLVSGFEPFGEDDVNPSERAVAALGRMAAPDVMPGIALRTLVLPTEFGASRDRLETALSEWPADIVLSVGLAGGRSGLSIERVAINLEDARIPDNAGRQPVDDPVAAGAPAAYFTTLPVKAMAAAIRDAGIEAKVSYSAGTFVCNHVFFAMCHLAAARYPGLRCGFIHIPWLPEQGVRHGGPSLDTNSVARGLAAALSVLVRDEAPGETGPAVSEGTLC